LEATFQLCALISVVSLLTSFKAYTAYSVSVASAQWHHQLPQPIKLRPGGSRYANLTGSGLDIFSAFPAPESPMLFSSSTQKVVESEEL